MAKNIRVSVANRTEDSSTANTIECGVSEIKYTHVKIKVLDCRSGKPVKLARVKSLIIDNGDFKIFFPKTTYKMHEKEDWDYELNDKYRKLEKIRGNDVVVYDAKKALNYLGYDHGELPSKSFGENARKMYEEYWNDRGLPKLTNEIYKCNHPPDEILKLITKEFNSHWGTDKKGILTVRIPRHFFDEKKLHIEVGFWDFPIALEELKHDERKNPVCRDGISRNLDWDNEKHDCGIEWEGGQGTYWNEKFGWVIKYKNQKSEFYVSHKLVVKNNDDSFSGNFDTDLLSKFYDKDEEPHFVLFAMQWCQPVWDGISDPLDTNAGSTNDYSYIQAKGVANLNMHIVTEYHGTYGGKFYGTTRHEADGGTSDDIDIHAKEGETELFAVHAATVRRYDETDKGYIEGEIKNEKGKIIKEKGKLGSGGKYVELVWEQQKERSLRYLHLQKIKLEVGENYVLPGRVLGTAGRTAYEHRLLAPDHVHLDDVIPGNGIISNRHEIDDELNRACIPARNYPLLLPCKCAWKEYKFDPSKCDGNMLEISLTCWAKSEGKCPKDPGNLNDSGH